MGVVQKNDVEEEKKSSAAKKSKIDVIFEYPSAPVVPAHSSKMRN